MRQLSQKAWCGLTRHYRNSAGFTLVETVIVIALSTIMMLAIGLLIFNFNNISSYDLAAANSSSSASALVREVTSLVYPADAVLSTHTFGGTAYVSSAGVLVLEIPSIDSSGAIISSAYDYAVFYKTGTNVYRRLEANASSVRVTGTKQLSTTVSGLTFTYDNADFTQVETVTIDLQTQATVKQNVITGHRSEQVRLRNH